MKKWWFRPARWWQFWLPQSGGAPLLALAAAWALIEVASGVDSRLPGVVLVFALAMLVSLLLQGGGDPNHPDHNQRHGPL